MNFTVLGPTDVKTSTIDGDFGGNRSVSSNNTKAQDYKKPSGAAPNRKENPQDVSKDIDEMTEAESRKREFSRREETSNVQKSNESGFISKTDTDKLPPEDTDAFIPEADLIKLRRSKNKYHFGSGQYNNNPNRGYEGELR